MLVSLSLFRRAAVFCLFVLLSAVSVFAQQEQSYYLAEGATGAFFDTDILLANPNQVAAPITITFLLEDGSAIEQPRSLPAMSRTTIHADDIDGLDATPFSTIVTSTDGVPLIVERTMRWGASGYGAHTEKAAAGAAPEWYFAEGSQGFFHTYFLLANPQAAANVAHVTYFREGAPAITRDYPLAPRSRATIDAGADAALRDQAFGARVVFELPGIAERSMYFGENPFWSGGSGASGATAPAASWFFAEGATGTYFTTYILLANPNDEPADVALTYLPDTGLPVTKNVTIPGGARVTRNIALEDAALTAAAVATRVESTRPIVAERAQYWGQPAWLDSHATIGVTAPALKWGLAEGRSGGVGEAQTFILVANPGTDIASVTATFLREADVPLVKHYTVPPTSRFTIGIAGEGSLVPELDGESFGAIIEATMPIVVERAVYTNANGVTWAAGTAATGTPVLPGPAIGAFGANPPAITVGQSSTLSWSGIEQATLCAIDNGVGSVSCTAGDLTVTPTATTTYTLTATGVTSSASAATTVTVNLPPAPVLASITPAASELGDASVPVTLTGANFLAGATVNVTGGGFTVSNVTVVNGTTITATFAIDPLASPGPRGVSVTTAGGQSNAQVFTLNEPHGSVTFDFTNGVQSFTVPVGVTSITITASGGQGQAGATLPPMAAGPGGNGGSVTATFAVTSGEVLQVLVGAQGGTSSSPELSQGGRGQFIGGFGGGASEVRRAGTFVIVAGGGGGGGTSGPVGDGGAGGAGGDLTGAPGEPGGGPQPGGGGGGGTQSQGGAAGTSGDGLGAIAGPAAAGQARNGGDGGGGNVTYRTGGGGGGYFGGGGGGPVNAGNSSGCGGGGGGSSFASGDATNVSFVRGNRTGHGQVVITW